MKLLVISGFLGAGKTTFIKALAQHSKKEFAILENEYAAVGLDREILNGTLSNGSVNIWELTEGCICCSTKGDFASSVLTIANTVDPEYLVIEPTGVGMLGNILENIQQIAYERIQILSPITIVDGRSFNRYSSEFKDIYLNQLACAGTIVVSKMEEASMQELQQLEDALRLRNPFAEIVMEHYSTKCDDWWKQILQKRVDGTTFQTIDEETSDLPDTFSMTEVSLDEPEKLWLFLEQLIRGQFGNVIRAKGHVSTNNQTMQFDVADGKYSILLLDEQKTSKLVFIGTNINRQAIRKKFMKPVTPNKIKFTRNKKELEKVFEVL